MRVDGRTNSQAMMWALGFAICMTAALPARVTADEKPNVILLLADETGWRVDGKTNWLWSFSTTLLTYFMIDRSRGSPALMKFFVEEFRGTLVSDFWGAYNAVVCAQRQ